MSQRGFTLIELITIIVLLGILAVFALPGTDGDVTARSASDELMQAIRFAQQKSMENTAQPNAGIQISSGGFSFINTSSLAISWNLLNPNPAYSVVISPTGSITFNGRGVPTCTGGFSCNASTQSISISAGGNTATFYLEPYTGYVHR